MSHTPNLYELAVQRKSQHQSYDTLSCANRGIDRAAIIDMLKGRWEIPLINLIHAEVTNYYLRQWSGYYLHQQLHDGCITQQETFSGRKIAVTYNIIYQGCTALEAKQHPQVLCSFRASPYGNYVLVQRSSRAPFRNNPASVKAIDDNTGA
jgi:uncharacterized protein YqkB